MTSQANHPLPLNGNEQDIAWMRYALTLAEIAKNQGEVPVGAVLVKENQILGEGFNRPIALHDPTAHAEIQAIRQATQNIGNYRLSDTTLYVTLEPCMMCRGAIIQARVSRVVFGAPLLRNEVNHHAQMVGGILAQDCSEQLTQFFRLLRKF